MRLSSEVLASLARVVVGQAPKPAARRRSSQPPARGWERIIGEPRNAVLFALFAAIVFGGGRKVLHAWKARGAIGRLGEPDVTPDEVESAAIYGRAGLTDLFRILSTGGSAELRNAAGTALAVLWARDDLIAEEEKALVVRGFAATWHARRRYPRGLRSPIPFRVSYGVPFLREDEAGVSPARLEWSYRILGAKRAGLEEYSAWAPGAGAAEFTVFPGDFEQNGPHRVIFHARARTAGLTESWQLDLPQLPFSFELDPNLAVDALLALADSTRAEIFARAVRLGAPAMGEPAEARYLALNEQMAIRNPPSLIIMTPVPCDLAHTVEIEIETIPGRFSAGEVLLPGQGVPQASATRACALGPITGIPHDAIDRPGTRRVRAVLTPDPDRGWADPDIRSIWPGIITTDWADVELIRR
jgi:hypothetical protein